MPIVYPGTNTFPASLTLPLNGEPAEATVVADGAWKALADRTVWNADQHLQALLNMRPETCNLTTAGTTTSLNRLSNSYCKDVMTGVITLMAPTLPLTAATGMAPAKSIRYVYLLVTAGVYSLEVSATAPDAKLIFKSGTQTHKYLGALRAYVGGTYNRHETCGGVTLLGTSPSDVAAISSIMPVTEDLLLPVTTTTFMAKATVVATGMALATYSWGPAGGTRVSGAVFTTPDVVTFYEQMFTDAAGLMDFTTNAATTRFTVELMGWIE